MRKKDSHHLMDPDPVLLPFSWSSWCRGSHERKFSGLIYIQIYVGAPKHLPRAGGESFTLSFAALRISCNTVYHVQSPGGRPQEYICGLWPPPSGPGRADFQDSYWVWLSLWIHSSPEMFTSL